MKEFKYQILSLGNLLYVVGIVMITLLCTASSNNLRNIFPITSTILFYSQGRSQCSVSSIFQFKARENILGM